jgi:5,10-methylenetetrahydromethanopterin reductase
MNQELKMPAYGVIFHPKFPPESLAAYARRAETAGFDELWLWDDCFLPGALTSAAIALAATQRLKVGIGLLPATVYNPLFAAMELTTLARAFPGRILPGFGHGVGSWMTQIGAAPKSSLKALEETVGAVRDLLAGEQVSLHGSQVNLEQVQMRLAPEVVPPLYIGAIRSKTLRLAGRSADGTLLTGMSSPADVRWALQHIRAGQAEAGRASSRTVVYLVTKVSPDGAAARAAARRLLASWMPWSDIVTDSLGITTALQEFVQKFGAEALAEHMPGEWLDAFAASGTPEQVLAGIRRMAEAGADSIVFQPIDGDPDCLDEYARYLMPHLK